MKYIVEYILDTPAEWNVWFRHGRGTETGPMSAKEFLAFERRQKSGEVIFFKVEVIL